MRFYLNMLVSLNKSSNLTFQSGTTRKFRHNIYHEKYEIIDIFNKSPQKNGITGELPKFWIEKLKNSKYADNINEVIKTIYKQMGQVIKLSNNYIHLATLKLNFILHKYGILSNKQNYKIKRVNKGFAQFMKNGYILEGNNNLEDLFIKEFNTKNKLPYFVGNRHGIYPEISRAMYINHNIKDRHIAHVYYGDTKNAYIMSEYVKPLKKIESLKYEYPSEEECLKDLEDMYGFTKEEIKKNKVIIGEYTDRETFSPFSIDRIISNYFNNLLKKYNIEHSDLLHNINNCILTLDKNNKPLLKLIDFGGIKKYTNE